MALAENNILREIHRSDCAMWFCYSPDYNDEIVILKTQMDSAKAIYQGCDVEIGLEKKEISNCFAVCSFINIHDLKDSSFFLVQAIKDKNDYENILRAINKGTVLVVVLDELLRIIFTAKLRFIKVNLFSEIMVCYDYSYDQFDSFLEEAKQHLARNDKSENFYRSKVEFSEFEVKSFDFINIERGEYFERSIYASLAPSFQHLLFKSPNVIIGKKKREFTDVFAVNEDFCLLIEAKSLVANNFYIEKSQSKYIAGLISHIRKAIRQLTGAVKAFRRHEKIFDGFDDSKIVNCDRDCPIYALILIPELIYHEDWSVTAQQILKAYNEVGCYMCLMDFSELLEILKITNGQPKEIEKALKSHFDVFIEHSSVHVRIPRYGQDRPYM